MDNTSLPLLARQPILNRRQKVVGYELLCRPVPQDTRQWQDVFGDHATSEVLISAFNDIGIDQVTGGLPAFINFTRHWLHNPPMLPSRSEERRVGKECRWRWSRERHNKTAETSITCQ